MFGYLNVLELVYRGDSNRYQQHDLSLVMRKPAFCLCENKDADQLRGSREADQSLLFSLNG